MKFERLQESLISEKLSYDDAVDVFKRAGAEGSVRNLSSDELARVWKKLAVKHHPDRGGELSMAQHINAAYDILKKGPASTDRRGSTVSTHPSAANVPEWAWAGWFGGLPPSSNIYRNDYSDKNYILKRMWELSNHSREKWVVRQYDGRYWRNIYTAFASKKIFGEMAKAMLQWAGETKAIIAFKDGAKNRVYVLWNNGKFVPNPKPYDMPAGYDERDIDELLSDESLNEADMVLKTPEALAREKFGITSDIRDAAFVTKAGAFIAKKFGDAIKNIGSVFLADSEIKEPLAKFNERGNIQLDSDTYTMKLTAMPSMTQLDAIKAMKELAEKSKKDLTLNLKRASKGEIVQKFPAGVPYDDVQTFVLNFYKG